MKLIARLLISSHSVGIIIRLGCEPSSVPNRISDDLHGPTYGVIALKSSNRAESDLFVYLILLVITPLDSRPPGWEDSQI